MSPCGHRLEPQQRALPVEDHRAVLGRPLLRGQEDVVAVRPGIGILPGDLHRGGRQVRPRVKRQHVARHPAGGRQRGRRNRSRRRRDREVERSRGLGAEDVQAGLDRDHLAGHERLRRQEAPAVSVGVRFEPARVHTAPRAHHDHLADLADRHPAKRDLRLRRRDAGTRNREHRHGGRGRGHRSAAARQRQPDQDRGDSDGGPRGRPALSFPHPKLPASVPGRAAATRPHTPPRIQIRAPSG